MQKHFTIILSGDLSHKGLKLRTMMLATKYDIRGSVTEDEHQIVIEAEGEEKNLDQFYRTIGIYGKSNSVYNSIHKIENQSLSHFEEFVIK